MNPCTRDRFAAGCRAFGCFLILSLLSCAAFAQMPSVIDMQLGEEDVRIWGASVEDRLGLESATEYGLMALGDLNDDGINDLIIASQFADGPSDARAEAGEVYIYYGSIGFSGNKDVAGAFGAAPDVVIYGATAGDLCGIILKVGDVTGDGIDDLVFGAPEADGPAEGLAEAGEAYVIFGSASLPSVIDLATGDEDVTIYGAGATDELTVNGAIELGDLNNDGKMDIIVGTYLADGAGNLCGVCGEAYIIYGSATLPATVDLANSEEDVIVYGVGQMTRDGTIAIGDVNDDQIDDLILGAPQPNIIRGEVYVIYGSGSLPSTIDIANGDEDVKIQGAEVGDELTIEGALVIGDISGDGIDDIVAGSFESGGFGGAGIQAGEVRVVFGSNSLPAVIDFANNEEDLVIFASGTGDWMTRRHNLLITDFNGDGKGDLVLGAQGAERNGGTGQAGEVYVLFGSSSHPSSIVIETDPIDVTITGADVSDLLSGGGSIAAGDFNGDGFDDLMVGASSADGPLNARDNTGDGHIFFGSSTIAGTYDLATSPQDVIIYGGDGIGDFSTFQDGLFIGGGVIVGDVNGDGLDDFIASGVLADGPFDARKNAGAVYIIFGASTFIVWADFGESPGGNGSLANPYDAFIDAVAAVDSGGTVRIRGDVVTTDSNETLTVTKPMTIEAVGGTVRIGLP